ncbi:hypothetical protein [Limosilactobacillus reuteri]|uniref:Uncharacterized protein n=1 Tax=Limosilactobacillus reuteri TaxID=1598 RepID=A0ABD6Y4I3_LIMRT|nr:hypothetical protein [Limosilactobacillus reuteri]PWT36611.1 hypothetical protein DKZ35_09335 [Limosilactobacillus reuteri]
MTLDSSHFQLVVYQRVIVTRYGKEVGMENGCGIKDPNSTRVYVVVSYAYPFRKLRKIATVSTIMPLAVALGLLVLMIHILR